MYLICLPHQMFAHFEWVVFHGRESRFVSIPWSQVGTTNIAIMKIIAKFDIFPLISQSDIVSVYLVILILENIGQCDITLWRLIAIKRITSLLKVSAYIITGTGITARPIRLVAILVIISVSTFKTDVILYLTNAVQLNSLIITLSTY
jgi:hypothetical protein